MEDEEAFVRRYPNAASIIGCYQGRLANGGEQLTLQNASCEILHTIFFDDDSPWPTSADGEGNSLVLANLDQREEADAWTTSSSNGSTPGQEDSQAPRSIPPA
ncbi:MAG: hypothetical protein ACI9DF_005689 [Verrucomicrobiales bacterium]